MLTLVPVVRRGPYLNHNETLVPVVRPTITHNHNETLVPVVRPAITHNHCGQPQARRETPASWQRSPAAPLGTPAHC